MITIPIQVSGDQWNNANEVKEILDNAESGQHIMLDLCSEGPSLHRLGVVKLISQYNLNVAITRWSNSVEHVPYRKEFCNANSHFFPMSFHYWDDEIENLPNPEYRFGLFQGRGCPSRNRIMYDVVNNWSSKFLVSKMKSVHGDSWGITLPKDVIALEHITDWFEDEAQAQHWFQELQIPSIDNHVIQDQFKIPEVSSGNMAKSLMQHYHRFNIELVCETYTCGESFFPTEKTIRPIVGNRPFIVYGPANYLNNLQKLKIRTFGNLWDESYDRYEGPLRWQAMSELINELLGKTDQQWQDIISEAAEITQHNRKIVRQMIRDYKGI